VTVEEVHNRVTVFCFKVIVWQIDVQGTVGTLGGIDEIPFDDHGGGSFCSLLVNYNRGWQEMQEKICIE
jgi:hypothetical protein